MDFVTGLPLDAGLNGLMVCIEKFTKLTSLIPCFTEEGTLMVPLAVVLFFAYVVQFCGLLYKIVHDQDPYFTSAL